MFWRRDEISTEQQLMCKILFAENCFALISFCLMPIGREFLDLSDSDEDTTIDGKERSMDPFVNVSIYIGVQLYVRTQERSPKPSR